MMSTARKSQWHHDHSFGQDKKKPGEARTLIVIAITVVMMIVEITTGILYGSMALLADGLHMASHAAALSISFFAYVYARKHAHDETFSFGTGKVNALGGFTGAVLLVLFALLMVSESIHRLISPVEIAFNQAILVAIVGLIINGASVFILGHENHDHHGEGHEHHHHDHNLRAAYLHVMADALTSVLAIVALLTAKYYGLVWMDPLMGIVGAALVTKWSVGLLRQTSGVLLDKQGPEELRAQIKDEIARVSHDHQIVDLHLWSIGPNIYATSVVIETNANQSAGYYKNLLMEIPTVVHTTVEIHPKD